MLRVVIDTSSLVSYVLTQGELMSRVVKHWRAEDFMVLASPSTLEELRAVLARPAIQRLSSVPLDPFLERFDRFTYRVLGRLTVTACRDAKDDKFLACAVEGEAHYLVSSDRDLLDMRRYQQVAIVNPGQFLIALELHALPVAALVAHFSNPMLAEIHTTIPLEPDTEARLRQALS